MSAALEPEAIPADNAVAELAHKPSREAIMRLEGVLREMPQAEIKTTHHFAHGIYAREIFIPKGCMLTGKIHKTDHINVVSQGSITVWTEQGMKRVSAPFCFVAKPGTKRVGYAHEDTVWTTFHPNPEDTHDLALLEDRLIAPSFAELEAAWIQELKEENK